MIDLSTFTQEEISKIISEYSKTSGALQVWSSWVNMMKAQGRDIKTEYLLWSILPERDKQLDAKIAYDVIEDFFSWLQCFYGDYDG